MLTLHYYFTREILKTFALTTLALTVLLVMGGGVANLFRGEGISPEEVLRVFVLLTPVAITLILPVAALFSATICYGRAAADNEVTACRAAGINIHRLLLSAFLLGLVVTAITYWSWNYLIPTLSRQIDEITRRSIPAVARTQFQKARPLVFGKYRITATRCEEIDRTRLPPDAPPGHTYLLLGGVAFLEVEDQEVMRYGTADATIIDFDSSQQGLRIKADLQGVRAFDGGRRQYYELKHQILGPFDLRLPIRRKMKFQDLRTLLEYQANPQSIPDIADRLMELKRILMSWFLWEEITRSLDPARGGTGAYTLVDGQTRYEFAAARFKVSPDDGKPLLGEVRVRELGHGEGERLITADTAFFELKSSLHPDRPVIMVHLNGNVQFSRPAEGARARVVRKDASTLNPIEYVDQPRLRERFESMNLADVLGGDRLAGLPPTQSRQRQGLIERIDRLRAEVGSEIQFRASYSLSTIAVVLLGAVLGIIVRGGQVLTAFGISCVPTMVVVLSSIVGRNLADRPQYLTTSYTVMWGATVLMYLATGVIAGKVLKR
jgi:lipopolysaccharide export LptBFGC system permease protein LptF